MSMRSLRNPVKRGRYFWHREPGMGGAITMSMTAAREIYGPHMKDPEFVARLRKCLNSGSIVVIPDG